MAEIPRWWMRGDWFDVCSCNVACPVLEVREMSLRKTEDRAHLFPSPVWSILSIVKGLPSSNSAENSSWISSPRQRTIRSLEAERAPMGPARSDPIAWHVAIAMILVTV